MTTTPRSFRLFRPCLAPLLLAFACTATEDADDSTSAPATDAGTTSGASTDVGTDESEATTDESTDATPADTSSSDASTSETTFSTVDDGSTGETGIVVQGSLADFLASAQGEMAPIDGAMICIRDQPEIACEVSDADGRYLFENVAEGPLLLVVDHPDYPRHLLHLLAEAGGGSFGLSMLTDDALALFAAMAGGEYDPTRGAVALFVADPLGEGQDGVTPSLMPMDDTLGTLFLDEMNLVDLDATATSSSGYFGWMNVQPGPHSYEVVHSSLACVSPLDAAGTGTAIEVEAGAVTSAHNYQCSRRG